MSTRLLLEGSDIQDLLARVREEHGPGVRIVQADKVRSGGVGGFFAREKFAVTIEVDGVGADGEAVSAAAGANVPVAAAPTSASPTHQPPAVHRPAAAQQRMTQQPRVMHQPAVTQQPTMSQRSVERPGSLLEMAEAIDVAEAAEVSVTMGTTGMATPTQPTQPVAVEKPASPVSPALRPISTERPDFAAVLAKLAQTTRTPAPTDAPAEEQSLVPAAMATVAAPESREVAAPAAASADVSLSAPTSVDAYSPATVRRPQPVAARDGVESNPLVRRLVSLGLPRELAQKLDNVGIANLRDRLVQVLDERPLQPASGLQAGDVLVIAGPGVAAYELAGDVARRLRLNPADVLLAAPSDLGLGVAAEMRISGPVEAGRRSGPLRRAEVPTIVVIDAPFDGRSGDWGRQIADALGAKVLWALVDATTKPGDVLDHLTSLGRVDGLVVTGTAATRDPASVLAPATELAVPTVLLDGRPGDAEAWATLLIDRIGELP